ncbi:NACHT domain-containing protein [Chloroflexi bacterium TSY]|nr:NACHT domain-containing protein [Chloroflexi bacterium TSY]
MSFTFHFLAKFEIVVGTQPVTDFYSDRARALLAYLALEPRAHTRIELATLLWPEIGNNYARTNLRNTLYRLRQSIDAAAPGAADQLFTATRQTVQFNAENGRIDVLRFQALLDVTSRQASQQHDSPSDHSSSRLAQLTEAAALYQGELLPGFDLADAPDFEEWLLLRREMLQQQAISAFRTLVTEYEAIGNYAQAHQVASRLLTLDPYQEETYRQIMRLLAQMGQPEQARQLFEQMRQLFRTELDVAPSAEIVAFMQQIAADQDDIRFTKSAVTRWRGDTVIQADPIPATPSHPFTQSPRSAELTSKPHPVTVSPSLDLRGIPDPGPFFGRMQERQKITEWLLDDRCRLVAILGIGGMGKTSLAAQCVRELADDRGSAQVDVVLWRSLLNAPPLAELLPPLLQRLSDQQLNSVPENLDERLRLLVNYLREKRALLVLDNMESILEPERAGAYRAGYEPYGQLIEQMAMLEHQSHLLLTSRERPDGYHRLERDSRFVQSLQLVGLDDAAGHELLAQRGLHGENREETLLVERYSGNPLALKLVADTIDELFAGDIGEFLAGETLVFDDIRAALDQQFARLSPLEQEILFWLAIAREPLSVPKIRGYLLHTPSRRNLMEALRNLQRRSMCERGEGGFGLQNVITEYLTDRLVETGVQELISGSFDCLHHHALIVAQAKQYVRQSQARLILQPIAQRLEEQVGHSTQREHLATTIAHLQTSKQGVPSYAAGNLLNLMLHLEMNVAGLDLTNLSVWQVDMQNRSVAGLNLAQADLTNCLFRQTFGRVEAVAISPDDQVVAIGGDRGEIRLHRLSDGQPLLRLTEHTNTVTALDFSPNGRLLASAGLDKTVRIWTTDSGHLLHSFTEATNSLHAIAFSSDSRLLASGGEDTTIYVWDVPTGHTLFHLKKHADLVKSLIFVPDSRQLLSASWDGGIFVWDLSIVEGLLANQQAAEPEILCEAKSINEEPELNTASLALSNKANPKNKIYARRC